MIHKTEFSNLKARISWLESERKENSQVIKALVNYLGLEVEHTGNPFIIVEKVVKSATVSKTTDNVSSNKIVNAPPTTDRNGDLTIQVSNIKLASGGDHPRWDVQGGNFTKYGITCWPEVLEEAGLNDVLDPMNDNLPEGQWLAYYVEDDKQRPDKVTKLVRQ